MFPKGSWCWWRQQEAATKGLLKTNELGFIVCWHSGSMFGINWFGIWLLVGYGFPTLDRFCWDFHLDWRDGALICLVCNDEESPWYISFGFGVTISFLIVIPCDCCGRLLLLELDEVDGETEKSGDGLDTIFCCVERKLGCKCWLDCPTIIRLFESVFDGEPDWKFLPPLKRGWNQINWKSHKITKS